MERENGRKINFKIKNNIIGLGVRTLSTLTPDKRGDERRIFIN